eukprot:TRINITY_DN8152_c0_g1_i1.p1 TRINITY_DN8152_c0_g1~~TRINITY_DN8152_c0_g1_i1.p1  ORF type:complete len:815 (+),score=230.48 TRINITY_DN8152_c0_g1_i1:84-2528(+)
MARQLNISIFAVIVVTTLVSTASSMAGGLILYYQGLESLELSTSETSAGELRALLEELLNKLDNIEEGIDTLRRFVYSQERFPAGMTSSECADVIRSFTSAQVGGAGGSFFSTGLFVTPHSWEDRGFAGLAYVEPLMDNTTRMLYGVFHDEMPENMTRLSPDGELLSVNAKIFALESDTGYIQKHLYNTETAFLFDFPDPGVSQAPMPREVGNYTERPLAGSAVSYWMSPAQWMASDRGRYWQTHLRAMYLPPPPPHPLSRYKTVALTLGLNYATFQAPFDAYKQTYPDTTVLLVNRRTGMVFASTILPMVPYWCQDMDAENGSYVPDGCALHVTNLSQAVQEGFEATGDEPFGAFSKGKLDGEEHFMRRANTQFQELELVWMRPTSSVQGAVREALVLLIVFTALVLVFDALVSFLEVIFIALPLRHLSSAIASLGDMETDAAAQAVDRYKSACVMVSEMRRVTKGMLKAVSRLEEFRAFIPESVLVAADDEGDNNDMEVSTNRSAASASTDSNKFASSPRTQCARQVLDLHLQCRSVGLLYVNAVGWWQHIRDYHSDSGRQLLERHTDLATAVLATVSLHNGVLDNFSGDRFLVGWNTAKLKYNSAQCAAATALEFKKSIPHVRLSCAVSMGRAWVGNAGTHTVRRFCVMSPLVPWVIEMEAFAKWRGYKCVTDDATASRLQHLFRYRIVDAIASHKHKEVVPVVHVMERIEVEEAEWMYQLEESENNDKDGGSINALARCIMSAQWYAAHEMEKSSSLAASLPVALRVALQRDHFRPLDLRFERTPSAVDISEYPMRTVGRTPEPQATRVT